MRFKIYMEYCGANYSGWQKQKNIKSIQETLSNAVIKVLTSHKGKFIDLQGSGRTDKGVHALGQVAHLECETMLGPEIIKMKVNEELPSDINILEVEKTQNTFHARHSAKSRQYLYRISKRRTAIDKKFVWWVKDKLNATTMKGAAELFTGMHNFKSFSEIHKDITSYKVLVEEISVTEDTDNIFIRIKASHFLWKMVRRITGVLVEAGRGNMNLKEIEGFINNYSDKPAQFTAPPSGLFLERVYY